MIKVLIVDDSPIVVKVIAYTLKSDPTIEVIGSVANGMEALSFIKLHKPDVITMDLNMPKMDGITATKEIMSKMPIPIIIVTGGDNEEENANSFKAIQAGAVAVVAKPNNKEQSQKLIEMIKLMSEVKVVKQHLKRDKEKEVKSYKTIPLNHIKIIVIGVSTGGPMVLQQILQQLKHDHFPPIVIVQHISTGFIQYMATWLHTTTKIPVTIASNGLKLKNGMVYLAPDFYHIGINSHLVITLENTKVNGSRDQQPSIAFLFRTVAKTFKKEAMGILLTGMGQDGAKELKILKEVGAITISQDESSCIVYGMPKVAKELGAAKYILSPDEIASLINRINE